MRGWSLLAAAVVVNYLEHRAHRSTICAVTRRRFRTHTPLGRLLFVASWAGFTGWLIPHILRTVKETT